MGLLSILLPFFLRYSLIHSVVKEPETRNRTPDFHHGVHGFLNMNHPPYITAFYALFPQESDYEFFIG